MFLSCSYNFHILGEQLAEQFGYFNFSFSLVIFRVEQKKSILYAFDFDFSLFLWSLSNRTTIHLHYAVKILMLFLKCAHTFCSFLLDTVLVTLIEEMITYFG